MNKLIREADEDQFKLITFESLPHAVSQLLMKVNNIELLLLQNEGSSQSNHEEILIIDQASKFLHLSLPTIYALVSNRKIPL